MVLVRLVMGRIYTQHLPKQSYNTTLGGLFDTNTCICEDLASHGYIVIAPDHTFDATCVILPHSHRRFLANSTAPPDIQTAEQMYPLRSAGLQVRVDDVKFILQKLVKIDAGELPVADGVFLRGRIDIEKVGVFGHSYGGMCHLHLV